MFSAALTASTRLATLAATESGSETTLTVTCVAGSALLTVMVVPVSTEAKVFVAEETV